MGYIYHTLERFSEAKRFHTLSGLVGPPPFFGRLLWDESNPNPMSAVYTLTENASYWESFHMSIHQLHIIICKS